MAKTLVNLTPHDVTISVNGVLTTIHSVGNARLKQINTVRGNINGVPVVVAIPDGIEGLPDPQPDVVYIVSGMVLDASQRIDIVAPATGPEHDVIRDQSGRIVAVTRLRANSSWTPQDCNCGSGFPVGWCPDCVYTLGL